LGLKIAWEVARAILTEDAWMVLPPDFLNVGGDTNPDVGGPFCHSGYFFVFNSFDDIICSNSRQGLAPICVADQQFYFRRLFAALASVGMNSGASIIARMEGVTVYKALWQALPAK
jgi:hypothetical protein